MERNEIVSKLAAAGVHKVYSGQIIAAGTELSELIKAQLFHENDDNAEAFDGLSEMELCLEFNSSGVKVSAAIPQTTSSFNFNSSKVETQDSKQVKSPVFIAFADFAEESLEALHSMLEVVSKYPNYHQAWIAERDKAYQKRELERHYANPQHALTFHKHPKYDTGELTPYIALLDMMRGEYVLRARTLDELYDQVSSPEHPVIKTYPDMDDLIEDGWRLD